jgi:hypothetical protein
LTERGRTRPGRNANTLRAFISTSISVLLLWLVATRIVPDYDDFEIHIRLLLAEAKCPGLPGGSTSGGPDYINIAIDVALAAVAVVFIYLTVRDVRRRRLLPEDSSNEDADGH